MSEKKSKNIIGTFRTDRSETFSPIRQHKHQTNPLHKDLANLTQDGIDKNPLRYRSFSNFKPNDLR